MKRLIVFFIFFLSVACGSRRVQVRNFMHEKVLRSSQLDARLFQNTELLKLVDIKIRKVEERDSVGNEKVITDTSISLREKINKQDTTKIKLNIDEKRNLEQNKNIDDNKKGVIASWAWIVGFIAVITMTLVIGIYVIKK